MSQQEHLSEDRVQSYVDGTESEPEAIRKHVQECVPCGRAVRRQERLARVLRRTVLLRAPEGLREAVLREARLARSFAATTRIATVGSMAFAAVATLAGLGAISWLSARGSAVPSTGPFGAATLQLSAWAEAAKNGIRSVLGVLPTDLFDVRLPYPSLTAVLLALAGVVVLDLLVGKKLARWTRGG